MFEKNGARLVWRFKEQTLHIEPWGKDSLRVRATALAEMPHRDWSLLPPGKSSARIAVDRDSVRIVNGKLTATVDAKSGRVRFFRTGSHEPLAEEISARTNCPPSRTFQSIGGDLFRCEACFTAFDD